MFSAEALVEKQRLSDDQVEALPDAIKVLLDQLQQAIDDADKPEQTDLKAQLKVRGYHVTPGRGGRGTAGLLNVSVAKFSQCCGKGAYVDAFRNAVCQPYTAVFQAPSNLACVQLPPGVSHRWQVGGAAHGTGVRQRRGRCAT